jgi:hypothetical protein
MLSREKKKKYIVFPSWLDPTYKWEDVPAIISDPLKYNDFTRLNYTEDDLRRFGYSEEILPFELIDGFAGGGIILIHKSPEQRWLPDGALTFDKGVDLIGPAGTAVLDWKCNVAHFENRSDPLWQLELGKKRKNYEMAATPEHIESMPDCVFWLIRFVPTKTGKQMKGLDDVPGWAKHFGLDVRRLEEPPEPVRKETADWFNPDFQRAWFEVKDAGDGFGYNFAVMLYIGLHLCSVSPSRMRCMHLLASIEGKPRFFARPLLRSQKT